VRQRSSPYQTGSSLQNDGWCRLASLGRLDHEAVELARHPQGLLADLQGALRAQHRVLAAHDNPAEPAFRGVVVEWDPWIGKEPRQAWPQAARE
jgi:hypothetical protein